MVVCVDDFSIVSLDKIAWSLIAGEWVSSAIDILIAIGDSGELGEQLELFEELR